jgi:hypothetical protein
MAEPSWNRASKRRANVSGSFEPNLMDARILANLLKFESTPLAILYFSKNCHLLSDYAYWFGLSTTWVSYTGFSDLKLWRTLFLSERADRERSIMKPDEIRAFRQLPPIVTAYRAHRSDETDWMSYTTRRDRAEAFLRNRPGGHISKYQIPRELIVAYFLRRGEFEILVPGAPL